jgi:ubiquinone/menaquinone biosynthesis C-methylase UbiE
MAKQELFDEWPEKYENWFRTPIGGLVRKVESQLIAEMVIPKSGEFMLDAGCGTGIFTTDFLTAGCRVVGLDISRPMLKLAVGKAGQRPFTVVEGDMRRLPFRDSVFDKAVSITALEFIAEPKEAIDELFRVTRPGGVVVVATLNSLSSWAERRQAKTRNGQRHILENAYYRNGKELLGFSAYPGVVNSAVHFTKDDEAEKAVEVERRGRERNLETGAFVAVKWEKSR